MTRRSIHRRIARWLSGLVPLAVICPLTLAPARAEAQAGSAAGRGAAVVVTTTTGVQQFASVGLPSAGGMADSALASVVVPSALSADELASISAGQLDQALVSTTTTAQAANVNVLNGLITAEAVLAVATSYANGVTATSESSGSALVGLMVNGVTYADGAPAPNTQVSLPGVGYVVLNEQIPVGDGAHNTGLTVNMIHVYLTDPTSGTPAGDIVVGTATSAASL
jgi:hypothetical protein